MDNSAVISLRSDNLPIKSIMLARSGEDELALFFFLVWGRKTLGFTPNIYWMHQRPRRFELHFPRWDVGPMSDFSLVDGRGRPGHLSVDWVCLAVRRLRPTTFQTIRGLALRCFTGAWKPTLSWPCLGLQSLIEALSPAETGEGRLQMKAVGSESGVY